MISKNINCSLIKEGIIINVRVMEFLTDVYTIEYDFINNGVCETGHLFQKSNCAFEVVNKAFQMIGESVEKENDHANKNTRTQTSNFND